MAASIPYQIRIKCNLPTKSEEVSIVMINQRKLADDQSAHTISFLALRIARPACALTIFSDGESVRTIAPREGKKASTETFNTLAPF